LKLRAGIVLSLRDVNNEINPLLKPQ
jgi:hypothetical protein